jgi:indolepyruvate ferredoxin oxidoreductase
MAFPIDAARGGARARPPARAAAISSTAGRIATSLLGDSIATNLFMLGYACQKGLLPVSAAAIERAIELNGDIVARRVADLTAYQRRRLRRPLRALVDEVRAAENEPPRPHRARGDGRALRYKLLAYKDEYEVARLYTDGRFARRFEGDVRLAFHMAPPLLTKKDPHTGLPAKRTFGAWMLPVLRALASLRGLRGTPLDPFGRTAERRAERALIEDYEATVRELAHGLTPENYGAAVAVAEVPEHIRGYGHVKETALRAPGAARPRPLPDPSG